MFWSSFAAVSQWRGFRDRLDIDGVPIVHLLSVSRARAADAYGGATAPWPARNSRVPLT
jgi:hypothetical protein